MLEKKEITDSVIYATEAVVSGLFSIVFYILIANELSLKDVGAYALAIVYASIFAGIANFGLVSGYERTYFEFVSSRDEKGSLIASLQFFSAIIIIIIVSIGIYFSQQLTFYLFGDTQYAWLWILVLIGVNISEFRIFYRPLTDESLDSQTA